MDDGVSRVLPGRADGVATGRMARAWCEWFLFRCSCDCVCSPGALTALRRGGWGARGATAFCFVLRQFAATLLEFGADRRIKNSFGELAEHLDPLILQMADMILKVVVVGVVVDALLFDRSHS